MGSRRDRLPDGVRLLSGLAALGCCLLAHAPATAQIVMMEAAPVAEGDSTKVPGFQIQVDESLATSFDDFKRHAKRRDWEKAFRSLSEIPSDKRTGMLRGPDGMIVPAGNRIWESIATLPADGRQAFRVFYDAKARNLWEPVGKPDRKPSDDLQTARRVYEEFFLTSVGDDAANYLGEAAFEQGEFRDAERYWKAILDHHPNSDLGELNVQVKRSLALLRIGRLAAVDAIVTALAQRFSGESVVLGGEPVEAVAFLKSLREAQRPVSAEAGEGAGSDSHLPSGPLQDETQTAWRLQYLSEGGKKQLDASVSSNYWYRNGMESWVPPFAVAEGRVFCNWFGVVFALDARTGKLLWRSEKFDKIHGQFGQMPNSSANLEQYAIAASGDTVVAVWLNPERLNYYQEPFRLIAYDTATGKEKWNTEKLEPLKDRSFVGTPLVTPDEVLVTSHKRNESKLQLLSLKLADGSESWSFELGTAQQTSNRRGRQVMPLPHLLRDGQTLYVLTNNGALLAFDLGERQLAWALKYGSQVDPNSGGPIYYSGQIDAATLLHSYGVLLQHEGLLYAKEAGGPVIHAIDPSGPKLLWSRPIAEEGVLVGADDEFLYVLSNELLALDRETQKLAWSRRLPIEGGGLSAVVGDDTLYVCSRRGIYCLAKSDGKLQNIFRGEDLGAVGAWIDVVGDRIISISNTAVTAYPVSAPADRKSPSQSDAAVAKPASASGFSP